MCGTAWHKYVTFIHSFLGGADFWLCYLLVMLRGAHASPKWRVRGALCVAHQVVLVDLAGLGPYLFTLEEKRSKSYEVNFAVPHKPCWTTSLNFARYCWCPVWRFWSDFQRSGLSFWMSIFFLRFIIIRRAFLALYTPLPPTTFSHILAVIASCQTGHGIERQKMAHNKCQQIRYLGCGLNKKWVEGQVSCLLGVCANFCSLLISLLDQSLPLPWTFQL